MTQDRDSALKPQQDAGKASAEAGVVILDGPDGVAVTMTADAALGTADSLRAAAKAVQEGQAAPEPAPGDARDDDAAGDSGSEGA